VLVTSPLILGYDATASSNTGVCASRSCR